ncbi:unnamed protein product [Penicillium salamii]|uniref:Subtilisin-like serine protease protein n=1 Tax=Penicillium salamii TaxID=1612424 RepID=A0A9W4JAZ4_9EURO|nr:unnamed protein product [Penicillium salamii]CAG7974060.1 unnamed protein product [Penicillium salamii]CAG8031069.1 unnamed protein product [Penicillium salamii]CAG8060775.1 unnamed protein product [Penicillium salamii]CAG8099381.1 unnamed protein product [Penicillium salamii]
MAPFSKEKQLYDELEIAPNGDLTRNSVVRSIKPPKDYLPGEPRLGINDHRVYEYLQCEFMTETLNDLSPHLWLVATQDSTHISSLRHQIVRGRNVIITEDPGLHLVWIYDRVFVKPMPKYLLSHAFWEFYLADVNSKLILPAHQEETKKAILGFMRSYTFLIRHKSDFDLATNDENRLLPKNITYSAFVKFIMNFEGIPDESVSLRYKFGDLRLSRLNFWITIFHGRFTYHNVHGYYGAYFARFYGPLLFVFGVLSVVLSAMQVALAVGQPLEDGSWSVFAYICRGFATCSIFCVALIIVVLLAMLVFRSLRETIFALKAIYKRKAGRSGRSV